MKNEKLKTFFLSLGAFFAGLFTIIGSVILHHGRTASDTGTELDTAEAENRRAGETVGELSGIVDDCKHTAEELRDLNTECSSIFEEIRKQKLSD